MFGELVSYGKRQPRWWSMANSDASKRSYGKHHATHQPRRGSPAGVKVKSIAEVMTMLGMN
jgi:hypothetical protein